MSLKEVKLELWTVAENWGISQSSFAVVVTTARSAGGEFVFVVLVESEMQKAPKILICKKFPLFISISSLQIFEIWLRIKILSFLHLIRTLCETDCIRLMSGSCGRDCGFMLLARCSVVLWIQRWNKWNVYLLLWCFAEHGSHGFASMRMLFRLVLVCCCWGHFVLVLGYSLRLASTW